MKVLHIMKWDLDSTAEKIIEVQRINNEVTIASLYDRPAAELLDLVESHDKLIMW